MSKAERGNRPKSTPSTAPKSDPKKRNTLINRILLIGALGAVGVVASRVNTEKNTQQVGNAANKFDARRKKVPYDGPGKELFSSPKFEWAHAEYEQWSKAMPLPQVKLSEGLSLSAAQKQDMFFEKDFDRTKLDAFYKYFHEVITATESGLKDAQTQAEKQKTVEMFIMSLMSAYAGAFQGGELGTKRATGTMRDVNLIDYTNKINRVLIPHGFYVIRDQNNDNGFNFELHSVEQIQNMRASIGVKEAVVPAITIKKQLDITAIDRSASKVPGGASYLEAAFYQPQGQYVVLRGDMDGNLNPEAVKKHEAAHVGFDLILDGYKGGNSKIGRHGVIHMGRYQLAEDDYRGHTQHELDELIGLGTELMNLDDDDLPSRLTNILNAVKVEHGPAYGFAAFIVLYEISYSLSNEDYIAFVNQFRAKGVNYEEHLKRMPVALLRPVGERMVRLGMKLSGKYD